MGTKLYFVSLEFFGSFLPLVWMYYMITSMSFTFKNDTKGS